MPLSVLAPSGICLTVAFPDFSPFMILIEKGLIPELEVMAMSPS